MIFSGFIPNLRDLKILLNLEQKKYYVTWVQAKLRLSSKDLIVKQK